MRSLLALGLAFAVGSGVGYICHEESDGASPLPNNFSIVEICAPITGGSRQHIPLTPAHASEVKNMHDCWHVTFRVNDKQMHAYAKPK